MVSDVQEDDISEASSRCPGGRVCLFADMVQNLVVAAIEILPDLFTCMAMGGAALLQQHARLQGCAHILELIGAADHDTNSLGQDQVPSLAGLSAAAWRLWAMMPSKAYRELAGECTRLSEVPASCSPCSASCASVKKQVAAFCRRSLG